MRLTMTIEDDHAVFDFLKADGAAESGNIPCELQERRYPLYRRCDLTQTPRDLELSEAALGSANRSRSRGIIAKPS